MGEFMMNVFGANIPFLRYAFIIGLLASVAFGIMGTFVVTRRITSIAGAIAHSVLGGIGAALFLNLNIGLTWIKPVYGAITAALLSAFIIWLVSIYAKQREDTVIGAIWAIGMATGLLFLARTPGYVNLHSYLFGNILLVSRNDIFITLILDALIIIPAVIFYNNILGVCFDSRFAELRGIKTKLIFLMLLAMTALTVVLLVDIVGIIMVIAMLTLPAAVAGHFTRRLHSMMIVSVILSLAFTSSGLVISFRTDLPSGPTIVIIAGFCYIVAMIFSKLRAKFSSHAVSTAADSKEETG
ncbi:MAG: metal ABC transporter permease [Lentisphaerae bacterium]|nr:metal ABC transporter permease [Lentisphaerota bacterium]MCP4101769.1 metal ABC transporter permease [Lentisphaerota bacterium]